MASFPVINIPKWISENKDQFLPPVCNKLMYNEQLAIMYIGGPNIREDYHIEEGEEFFYMVSGDMVLKIVEKGVRRDILIKEGEVFLLPARIPHSPQRQPNTVGLVIERRRDEDELDVLRYYVGKTTQPLYEKAFLCVDLGTQLRPIIEGYFASKEKQTGVPSKESTLERLPFELDLLTSVKAPFCLADKLKQIESTVPLFDGDSQFGIVVFTAGSSQEYASNGDHWIWQISGSSTVTLGEKEEVLKDSDTLLVPQGSNYKWVRAKDCKVIRVLQYRS